MAGAGVKYLAKSVVLEFSPHQQLSLKVAIAVEHRRKQSMQVLNRGRRKTRHDWYRLIGVGVVWVWVWVCACVH